MIPNKFKYLNKILLNWNSGDIQDNNIIKSTNIKRQINIPKSYTDIKFKIIRSGLLKEYKDEYSDDFHKEYLLNWIEDFPKILDLFNIKYTVDFSNKRCPQGIIDLWIPEKLADEQKSKYNPGEFLREYGIPFDFNPDNQGDINSWKKYYIQFIKGYNASNGGIHIILAHANRFEPTITVSTYRGDYLDLSPQDMINLKVRHSLTYFWGLDVLSEFIYKILLIYDEYGYPEE